MGHSYVGCEHLLLGLISEPAGLGGRVLRSMGAELTLARRAVNSALNGYAHSRRDLVAPIGQEAGAGSTAPSASPGERELLQQILARLDHIEAWLNR